MLKRLSTRQVLQNLAAEWEEALAREWLDAIRSITSAVTLQALIAELERGNLDAAMRLLNIDADRFARFEAGILSAYNAGGQAVVAGMPALRDPSGARVNFTWGVRNLPAEQAMRQHAASLVDDLVGEQLTIARQVLTDGLSRGQNPRQTALGLVGRVNRRTGFREGGVLGLTPSSVQTLDKIYGGLRSGDMQAMRDYLGYALRDKRFDGHVRRALEQGGAVPVAAVDRIVTSYSNKALKYRGDVISRHETLLALSRAQDDAFAQQIQSGKIDQRDLTKTWKHQAGQEHPRMQHIAMNEQTVAFGEVFTAPDGTQLRHPLDPEAPASHTLNCKCRVEYDIDHVGGFLRRYREETLG